MALQQLQVRPVITGATSTQIGKSLIASEAFFIDDFKPETLLRFASGQVETVHKKDCPFIPISALAFFGKLNFYDCFYSTEHRQFFVPEVGQSERLYNMRVLNALSGSHLYTAMCANSSCYEGVALKLDEIIKKRGTERQADLMRLIKDVLGKKQVENDGFSKLKPKKFTAAELAQYDIDLCTRLLKKKELPSLESLRIISPQKTISHSTCITKFSNGFKLSIEYRAQLTSKPTSALSGLYHAYGELIPEDQQPFLFGNLRSDGTFQTVHYGFHLSSYKWKVPNVLPGPISTVVLSSAPLAWTVVKSGGGGKSAVEVVDKGKFSPLDFTNADALTAADDSYGDPDSATFQEKYTKLLQEKDKNEGSFARQLTTANQELAIIKQQLLVQAAEEAKAEAQGGTVKRQRMSGPPVSAGATGSHPGGVGSADGTGPMLINRVTIPHIFPAGLFHTQIFRPTISEKEEAFFMKKSEFKAFDDVLGAKRSAQKAKMIYEFGLTPGNPAKITDVLGLRSSDEDNEAKVDLRQNYKTFAKEIFKRCKFGQPPDGRILFLLRDSFNHSKFGYESLVELAHASGLLLFVSAYLQHLQTTTAAPYFCQQRHAFENHEISLRLNHRHPLFPSFCASLESHHATNVSTAEDDLKSTRVYMDLLFKLAAQIESGKTELVRTVLDIITRASPVLEEISTSSILRETQNSVRLHLLQALSSDSETLSGQPTLGFSSTLCQVFSKYCAKVTQEEISLEYPLRHQVQQLKAYIERLTQIGCFVEWPLEVTSSDMCPFCCYEISDGVSTNFLQCCHSRVHIDCWKTNMIRGSTTNCFQCRVPVVATFCSQSGLSTPSSQRVSNIDLDGLDLASPAQQLDGDSNEVLGGAGAMIISRMRGPDSSP